MSWIKLSTDDNIFFTARYNSEFHLVEHVWHKESERMSEEEYKQNFLAMIDNLPENCTPKRYLLDHRDFLFSIVPELQEWHDKNVFAKAQTVDADFKTSKIAIVTTDDFVAQLSIEQAMKEGELTENTRYFDNEVAAHEWLKEAS